MLRRPLLAFSFIVGTLIFGALWFIQSPQFAQIVKTTLSQHLPQDIGVSGDFKEFSVQLFPPALSVREPKIWIKGRNPLGLPSGSFIHAQSIDFKFLPLQILSGDIWVHEVAVHQGNIKLILEDPGQKPSHASVKKPIQLDWDELFQIHAESISLTDTFVDLEFLENGKKNLQGVGTSKTLKAKAYQLKVAQKSSKGGLGYALQVDLGDIEGSYLKNLSLPDKIDRMSGLAFLNSKGLALEEFLITKSGATISTQGQLKGDLLNLSQGLNADLKIKLQGELSDFLKALGQEVPQEVSSIRGSLDMNGQLVGNLARPEEGLDVSGRLNLRNFSYSGWSGDLLQVDASWKASPSGGEVALKKAILFAEVKPRVAGEAFGQGGRVELGELKWKVGSKTPLHIPLKLDHAHIHWLVGKGADSIFPLDFRMNGETEIVFTPPQAHQSWKIHANLRNWVEDFQLDNQKLREKKTLRKVFEIPRIELSGPVLVDSQGVFPKDLSLKIDKSELKVKGKIDFKKGLELIASGGLRLEDLGEIAENTSRGVGTVQVNVHGPFSSVLVDVDVDLKDAFYVNLFLGDLKGRITWDDDKNFLYITRAKLRAEDTLYSVDGHLDLGDVESIHLDAKISQGNMRNIAQIIQNLMSKVDVSQSTLSGSVQGDVKIRGGLETNLLQVFVDLHGKNWEYLKEKFRSVNVRGGYDQGKIFTDSFALEKRDGTLQGQFSYDIDQKFYAWNLKTQNLDLNEIDALSRLDVPIRSKIDLETSGKGRLDSLHAAAELSLTDTSFHGKSVPASYVSMRSDRGEASFHGIIFGGQALLDASYNWNPQLPSFLQLDLRRLDFSPVLLFLNKSLVQDQSFSAQLTGGVTLKVFPHQKGQAQGSFSVTELLLAKKNLTLQLDQPVAAQIHQGEFKLPHLKLKSKDGALEGYLENQSGALKGELFGSFENSISQFFSSAISQVSGSSTLQLFLGGSTQNPKLTGRVQLKVGQLNLDSFDSAFENIGGEIQFKHDRVQLHRVSAELGGGRVNLDGDVHFFPEKGPEVNLQGSLKEAKIKIQPFQFIKLSGSIQLRGSESPYSLDGHLMVHSALSKEKMLSSKKGTENLKTSQQLPLPSQEGRSEQNLVKLNLEVEAPQGILFQNDLFRDLQARAKLKVVNTLSVPRILGRAEVLQGKLVFKDHVFQVQSGSAVFDNPTDLNPSFDLVANTEINNVKIQMFVSGKKNDIRVELSSNPPMPESDLFGLLALGVTSADAKKLDAASLSAIQQGEAASLLLHSLDLSRDIEEKTGFQVGLDEAVNRQQGVSAFRLQGDLAAAPQIRIRKKLGKRLSLSAGTTVGIGTSKANQFTIDYSVNPDLTLIGVYNNFTSYSAGEIQPYPTSLGMDLKFLKRFK